jgi:hypothetical protein
MNDYEDQPWYVEEWCDPSNARNIGDVTIGTWTCAESSRPARDWFDLFLMAEEWAIKGSLPRALWYCRAAEVAMSESDHG